MKGVDVPGMLGIRSYFPAGSSAKQRIIRFVLIGALLILVLPLSTERAVGATLTVTSRADSGRGSLRAKIAAAKPGDTINLPASNQPYKVTSDQIEITKPLTIKGAGPSRSVIAAEKQNRVFDISSGVPAGKAVTFKGVTITGGKKTTSGGGGIYVDETIGGNLVLRNTTVTKNVVDQDLGNECCGGGGGIYNDGTGSTILIGSSVTGNKVTVVSTGSCCHGGGGIFNGDEADLVVSRSRISNNIVVLTGPAVDGAPFSICCSGGGGVYVSDDAETDISRSVFSGNAATIDNANCCHGGGAIYLSEAGPDPTITKSTFIANRTTVTGPLSDDTGTGQQHCCHGGGAIFTQQSIDIRDTTFRENKAIIESGNCCHGGGALTMEEDGSGTTIVGSAFTGNRTTVTGPSVDTANDPHCCNGGGAIFSFGAFEIVATKLNSNRATVTTDDCCHGGGATMSFGPILLDRASISKNVFKLTGEGCCNGGGGIAIDSDEGLTVIESLISSNKANFFGPSGGLNGGGGVYEDAAGSLYVNSTISGNSTNVSDEFDPQGGGGIFELIDAGQDAFYNTTIASNSAPDASGGGVFNWGSILVTGNSIFALNTALSGANCGGATPSGGNSPTFTSLGYNLEDSANTCGFSSTGDQIEDAAFIGLAPLANNGGPTLTRALLVGSPAIGAGDPDGCKEDNSDPVTVDQRGIERPQGAECEIGAFEYDKPKLTVSITGKGKVTSVPPGINCPGACDRRFGHGTLITLKKNPDAGWVFFRWGLGCTGSGSCVVEMSRALTVTAKFRRAP